MLWRYELKKSLFTHRGIWIILICILLKMLFLMFFPELKDSRIKLSQKQYDKYLEQLYGVNTSEKSSWILAEYENAKLIIEQRNSMQERYSLGEISEEEWLIYVETLNQAFISQNALTIFKEKTEQFAAQSVDVAPAHYIYEYGWNTVYTLMRFPDIFLLLGLLIIAAQSFASESNSGMLPILLAARNGRHHLFVAKLVSLLSISIFAALLSGGLEFMVIVLRGWCNDGKAPLYSISAMRNCTLELSLMNGYLRCLITRSLTAILYAILSYSLSVWLKETANLCFVGVCIIVLPMLWNGNAMLYTHSGLLRGSYWLRGLATTGVWVHLPLFVVAIYSVIFLSLAGKQYVKGLADH